MPFEFSLAHLTVLRLSPIEMIKIAARTGYQYVSLRLIPVVGEPLVDLINNKENLRQTLDCLEQENVRVHDIELVRLPPDVDPLEFKPLLETGAELGARGVMVQIPDGDKNRAIENFGLFCDLAASFGLTADLEFLPWIETANVEEAAEIISGAARPNAGLLVDTLHFYRSNSTLEQLQNLPAEWFHFVQLCDAKNPAPKTEEDMINVARADRFPPGQGDLDLKALLEAMPLRPYSLEIPNTLMTQELGIEAFCRNVREAAENLLNQCHFASTD